jgi:uncharacterized iron-regulated membrane protein
MCLVGKGGTTQGFAIAALFLSVLPLASLGAVIWYLRRRAREIEAAALRAEPEVRELPAAIAPAPR